jgi:hypothetical protein
MKHEIVEDVLFICYRLFDQHSTEFREMERIIEEAVLSGIRKIIFDIRYNPGGTGPLNVVNALLLSNGNNLNNITNRYGVTVAVLTNNHSHSAAVHFAAIAQDTGHFVLIGEPSVCAPSFWGSVAAGRFTLPNTGIQASTSFGRVARWDANANQDMFEMDVLVPSDKALDAAMGFFGITTYPSIAMTPRPLAVSPFEPPLPPLMHVALSQNTANIVGADSITVNAQDGAQIRNIIGTDFDIKTDEYQIGGTAIFFPLRLNGEPNFVGTPRLAYRSNINSSTGDVFISYWQGSITIHADIGTGEEHGQNNMRAYHVFTLN